MEEKSLVLAKEKWSKKLFKFVKKIFGIKNNRKIRSKQEDKEQFEDTSEYTEDEKFLMKETGFGNKEEKEIIDPRIIELQKRVDEGLLKEKDLSDLEKNKITKLYKSQIVEINQEIEKVKKELNDKKAKLVKK